MYDSMPWFSLIKLADDPEYGDLYTVPLIIVTYLLYRAKSSFYHKIRTLVLI